MSDGTTMSNRFLRALAASCVLIAGTVPLGVALFAAIAATLSDNPDATGPGDGAFLFALAAMIGCTAVAAVVGLEPAVRGELGRWWFGASVLALAPVYPLVAGASVFALRGNGSWVVAVAFILLCGIAYVSVWAAGARRIGHSRAARRRAPA
jgi:hypothetical protein